MGTKRKLYRAAAEVPYEEPSQQEDQEETEVGMKDMMFSVSAVIIILVVAFLSPNF